jgi:hypothetical protein
MSPPGAVFHALPMVDVADASSWTASSLGVGLVARGPVSAGPPPDGSDRTGRPRGMAGTADMDVPGQAPGRSVSPWPIVGIASTTDRLRATIPERSGASRSPGTWTHAFVRVSFDATNVGR